MLYDKETGISTQSVSIKNVPVTGTFFIESDCVEYRLLYHLTLKIPRVILLHWDYD